MKRLYTKSEYYNIDKFYNAYKYEYYNIKICIANLNMNIII
jgi:hypothetical protein